MLDLRYFRFYVKDIHYRFELRYVMAVIILMAENLAVSDTHQSLNSVLRTRVVEQVKGLRLPPSMDSSNGRPCYN